MRLLFYFDFSAVKRRVQGKKIHTSYGRGEKRRLVDNSDAGRTRL